MKQQQGVTLIELMITLAIATIILTAVGPSIQSILIKNRIVSEINEISSIIQYARHQAIDEQTLVKVCPTSDYKNCSTDWNNAKMVFIDSNSDDTLNGAEELIVTIEQASSTSVITSTENVITFQESGQADKASQILLCDKTKKAEYARAMAITLQGRVKMSSDSDNDGVYEDINGNDLSC